MDVVHICSLCISNIMGMAYNCAVDVSLFCGFVECTCISICVRLTVGFENNCILAYAMYCMS